MAASLAKQLRSRTEHDDEKRFDLANWTELQSHDLVQATFKDPIDVNEPLRFTFIIGGGRLVRQKYDESLGKWLCAELRAIGYSEDKGAAVGSTECFKMQHDLGQNLIYLHVFPRLNVKKAAEIAGDDAQESSGPSMEGLKSTPFGRCLTCEQKEFENAITSRVPAWSHKRALLNNLQAWLKQLEASEAKMVARQPLSPEEQAAYDLADRPTLEGKVTWLQAQAKDQVTAGRLTDRERETVISEMDTKLQAMKKSMAEVEGGAGGKKGAALTAQVEQLEGRRLALQATFKATSAAQYPIKPALLVELRKVSNSLAAIDKLERANAGKLLSVAERIAVQKSVDSRPELQERLAAITDEAKFWFESEEEWTARLKEQMGGGSAVKAAGGGRR